MASGFPPPRIIWTKASGEQVAAIGGGSQSSALLAANAGKQDQLVKQSDGMAPTAANGPGRSSAHHLGAWVFENGSLNILDARDSDFGHYMCQASNGVGPGLSKVIRVTINVAAQFQTRHAIQYVARGELAHLKCQAKGDWPIFLNWYKGKQRLEPVNLQEINTNQQEQSSSSSSLQLSANSVLSAAPVSSSSASSSSLSLQSSGLISNTIASLLLLPPESGLPLTHLSNQSHHKQQQQQQSFANQLSAWLSLGGDNIGATGQHRRGGQQVDEAMTRKATSSGGGLLMSRYSLSNSEYLLASSSLPPTSSSLSSSSSSSLSSSTLSRATINNYDSSTLAQLIGELREQRNSMLMGASGSGGQFSPSDSLPLSSSSSSSLSPSSVSYAARQQPYLVQVNSVLAIQQAERQDTGVYKCLTMNNFGFDERTIQLIVQEPPDRTDELSVLETNSRSITLGWLAPYDGNEPIINYHIQYRLASPLAQTPAAQPQDGGAATINQRAPSSSSSLSSDSLNTLTWFNYTVSAAATATSDASSENSLKKSLSQATDHLLVANSPTAHHYGSGSSGPSLAARGNKWLETSAPPPLLVAAGSRASRQLNRVTVNSLRPMSHYWFRIEAENKLGRGPVSSIVETVTMEEAPAAAPTKVKAVAQSSTSILVSWAKLNEREAFGLVQGYYVAYRPTVTLGGNDSSSNNSNSNSAKAGSVGANYDATEQQQTSVPSSAVNSMAAQSNVINIYKTIQHDDKLAKFDALLTGLKKSTKYVISVQAFNGRGTGPSSEPIVSRTLDMDPPRQLKLFVKQATNCSIEIEWRPLSQAALQLLARSSSSSSSSTTGPMSSSVQSYPASGGSDASTTPVPEATATTPLSGNNQNNNNRLVQQQSPSSGDAEVVDYYSLYRAELNDQPRWQETRLPGHASSHLIEQLNCGTRYQFYMMGVNKIGLGDQSDILDTTTAGGLPIAPDRQSTFDVINTTCYVVRLDHWQDNGCPIRQFNIRRRLEPSREWIQVAHFDLSASLDGANPTNSASSSPGSQSHLDQQQQPQATASSHRVKNLIGDEFQSGASAGAINDGPVQRSRSSNRKRSLTMNDEPELVRGDEKVDAAYSDDFVVVEEEQQDAAAAAAAAATMMMRADRDRADDYDSSFIDYATSGSDELSYSASQSENAVQSNNVSDDAMDETSDNDYMALEAASLIGKDDVVPRVSPRSAGELVNGARPGTRLASTYQQQAPHFDSLLKAAPPLIETDSSSSGGNNYESEMVTSTTKNPVSERSAALQPMRQTLSSPLSSSSISAMPQFAQEWQSSNFVVDTGQQHEATKGQVSGNQLGGGQIGAGGKLNSAEATALGNKQDWRRVRLCNLAENAYYVVQIRAQNRVGETEAELRLLTSPEGIEYDHDIKRHVVGRLGGANNGPGGGHRMAHSIASLNDRFNGLIVFNQWPILVPIMLALTLMTIVAIIALLLKKSTSGGGSPGSSSTTSTATTTTLSLNPNGSVTNMGHYGSDEPATLLLSQTGGQKHHHNHNSSHHLGTLYRHNNDTMRPPNENTLGHHHIHHHQGAPSAITTMDGTYDGSDLVLGAAAVDNYAIVTGVPARPMYATSQQQQQQTQGQYGSSTCPSMENKDMDIDGSSCANINDMTLANIYQQRAAAAAAAAHLIVNQQQQQHRPAYIGESPYGLAGLNVASGGGGGGSASGSGGDGNGSLITNQATTSSSVTTEHTTNLSNDSPSTTVPQSINSNHSSADASNTVGHMHHHLAATLPLHPNHHNHSHLYNGNFNQHAGDGTKGFNVYLCTKDEQQEKQQEAAIFYGLSPINSQQAQLYGQQVQMRRFQQDMSQQEQQLEHQQQQQQQQQQQLDQNNNNNNNNNDACDHQQITAPANPDDRMAFDPVYATIRRTFPQAFKYLTLQHHHHQNQQQQPPQHNRHLDLSQVVNGNQNQDVTFFDSST